MTTVETCDACRFDGAQYDVADARGTLRALEPMWRQMTAGIDEAVLATRPAAGVWSAVEYAAHSADIVEAMGRLLHGLLVVDDLVLPSAPDEPPAPDAAGMEAAIARLGANATRLDRRAGKIGGDDAAEWARSGRLGDQHVDAAGTLRHAVHDAVHHLRDVGRGLHQLGAGAPTQSGTLAQINVSGGGVPKRPVDAAEVDDGGLVGDRQADRRHHGRPMQALCLWSRDVIDALRAEGHPIEPGAAGENLTVSGIDWTTLRPGVQLLVGEVLVEASAYAPPCAKNAQWFLDRDFQRIDHDRHPGWSRVYAWVREGGRVHAGDPVVVEP